MNKLITNLGGQPLRLNDLDYIQSNVQEVTVALAKMFSGTETAVILSGAVISVTNEGTPTATIGVTKGAIWFNDEIFIVPASSTVVANITLATVTSTYIWQWNSNKNTKTISLKNGLSAQVYDIRTALIESTLVSGNTQIGLVSAVKRIADIAVPTASFQEVIDGSLNTKYITPEALGRQGDNFSITFPGTVTNTIAYAPVIYKNGYFQSLNVDIEFNVGGTSLDYVDIVTSVDMLAYGYTGGFISVPCEESLAGYHTSYINLVGEFVGQNTLRLRKTYNEASLVINSSPSLNPKFTTNVRYRISIRFTK